MDSTKEEKEITFVLDINITKTGSCELGAFGEMAKCRSETGKTKASLRHLIGLEKKN